jgi:hypothetical protein
MEHELFQRWLDVQPLLAVVDPVTGILTLASILGSLFGGVGKKETQSAGLPPELMDQLLASLGIDTKQGLRNTLLTDPGFAQSLSKVDLNKLGVSNDDLAKLLSGTVPLRTAANQAAFGLLPRFARSENPQEALLEAAPRARFLRDGEVGPFDNFLKGFGSGDPTPTPGKGGSVPKKTNTKEQNCIDLGGTPIYENGLYIGCETS